MKVDTITHQTGEQIPILIDDDGMPIPTPNEFILTRRALSPNTLVRNLRELMVFYRWLELNNIDIWERVKTGRGFTEAEVNGGIVELLRKAQVNGNKVKRLAVSPVTFNQRLTTIRMFVTWCFDIVLGSLPQDDQGYEHIRDKKELIVGWMGEAYISAPPSSNANARKALKVAEVDFLLECLNPNNSNAIGRDPAVRFRNYISIMIMLYYGLRPGELLSLRVEDVTLGAISSITVERRPPDPKDTRRPRPQIKRNGRVMPIDDQVFEKNLDKYIMVWREELESNAESESDYLILSDEGDPLSQSTLTQFFQRIRNEYPNKLPNHLTAKALRHTFSSQMEKFLRQAGLDEDRRKQALADLRGDSSLESQNVYIAQEIEEQANNALRKYQKELIMEDIP